MVEAREIVEVSSGVQPFVIRLDDIPTCPGAKPDVDPRQVAKFELMPEAHYSGSLSSYLPGASGLVLTNGSNSKSTAGEDIDLF